MRVHELAKNRNFRDLNLPVSALYLLAKPSTPEEVVDAVVERVETGEKLTHRDVKAEIAAASPRAACIEEGKRLARRVKDGSLLMEAVDEQIRNLRELVGIWYSHPETRIDPAFRERLAEALSLRRLRLSSSICEKSN